MSNPQTPDVPVTTRKRTPKSAPARAGDGLSMYERAKLQIAERERKLKALQDKLMEDYTFTPQSTSNSIASSVVSSPEKVFERLYNVETAAMRARRASPRSANNSPTRPRVRGSKDGYVTPTRLQELHVEGQNKLRARKRTQQEEDEERTRRLEEQELSQCTFTPQTKWKIAAERRRKAREEAQREADEARARSLRPKTSEREQWHRIHEEEELKKCTFKPNLKWNIAKERRNMSREPRTLWDDDDDDDDEPPVPTQVPRTPRISTKGTNIDLSPLTDPRPTAKPASVDQPPQHQESPEKISGYATNIKLVSADNFQEDSGKVTKAPTVVRSNYIGAVVPPSPEWKQKYKKIGPKQTEEILEAKGSVVVGTMHIRSNFSSTIIAGGQKASSSKKSPMETPKKSAHTGVPSDAQSRDPLMIPQLAEPEVTAPTITPTLPSETVDNVAAEAMESTPSKENRQSWIEGLLQKKGESGEVATEEEHTKKIDADMDALLSDAEASASAQADALSRKLADEDSAAAAAAAAKANDTKTEAQEPEDKKKSKISTWKQRLLGKRSKSNDLKESGAKDDVTQASGAGTENSETIRADANADHDARIKAEEEARLKATEEAKIRAAEEARLKAEEEARLKAQEETRLIAEEDARLKAEEEALLKAEEARLRAEEEARLIAEEDARLKAEEEALLKAEEARLIAEEDARLKAEEEALLKAEEARLRAEEDARLKAEEEALLKAEEARLRAEEEARLKAVEEARLKAEEDARLRAEEEARLKAEEEARLKAEEDARLRAEEEARLKAEEEARLQAEEEARLKAEEDARLRAAEEARLKAEEEARLKAEEDARLRAAEDARLKAEEDARLRAAEEARLKAEEEARSNADEDVVLQASSEDAEALSTDDDEALVGEKPKKSDRAKKWKERLARKGSKDDAEQPATTDASPDLVEVRLDPPTEKGDTPLEMDPGAHQSDDDVGGLDGDDEGKSKKKSDRANKWKERLAKRTKGTKSKSKSGTNDDNTPPVAGVESPEKVAYPRVLLNEGDDSQLDKEPEIGSI